MTVCLIALGSNIGNRLANLRKAAESLMLEVGKVTAKSGVYETPPWGNHEQPRFLNACVTLETDMKPRELLNAAHDIEREGGRKERERWGPREIDVDILTYGEISLHENDLIIPHPLMGQRPFVLVPLSDIAPDWSHPLTGEFLSDLLLKTGREGIVRITLL
jgi:2-amino-4-hydroxy-6-hydroxymethyldihydropteridine diphosphokinase